MATPFPYPIHSVAAAVAQIDQGEVPWFAIGCFLHDWWSYAVDQRKELIGEPPSPTTTPDGKRWAAFCAATVEELCTRTSFPCPAWVHEQTYVLEGNDSGDPLLPTFCGTPIRSARAGPTSVARQTGTDSERWYLL